MRNRAIIAHWVMERGSACGAVRMEEHDGRHSVRIYDYARVRELFGQLLRHVQRVKSEGDYAAARELVETYGVMVDPALHAEVRDRYAALGIAPFSGFVNPRLSLKVDADGVAQDVTIDYDEQYDEQMLRYSREYASL